MLGFDPQVEKAFKSQILRITEELGNYGWPKNIATRVLDVYLVARLKNPNWLRTVSVFQRDDVTFVQYGIDPLFADRSEQVIDSEGNIGFVIHRYGKTLDSGIIQIRIVVKPQSETMKVTESVTDSVKKLKQEQIQRIDKALWEKGWTKEVAQIVLNDYLDVDNRTADWLKDVRMYEKGDGTTIVRYGDGRMWGHAPETRTRHYGGNLEITFHTSPGDNGTIELKTVKPEPVGNGIKDETATIQAQHDKGNKMNQANADTSGVSPTIESVGRLLKSYGANDNVVATVQTLMTQYNLGEGSIVSYVRMSSNGDIHLTLGSYERFDNARRNGMLIGDQEVHWLLDHEGGVFHITRKKKELSKEELLKKHVGEFKLMVVTPKGATEIPYDFVVTERGEDGIRLNVAARMEFYLKDGVFHNSKGPAYIAFNGRKNYVVNGQPLTEEEFNNRVLASQGSWKDIGA